MLELGFSRVNSALTSGECLNSLWVLENAAMAYHLPDSSRVGREES